MKPYNGFSPHQRMKAYNWLKEQYANGLMHPPTECDMCGQTEGVIEAHSEDYGPPYGPHIGEYGLCYRCHMLMHCRFRCPEAWGSYIALIKTGIPQAMHTRNFNEIRSNMAGGWPEIAEAPPQNRFDRKGLIPLLESFR